MKKVSLDELQTLAEIAREEIWAQAKSVGREPKIYLHWTAGRYESKSDHYHVNITGDGTLYVSVDSLAQLTGHTWKRNKGAVGITMCCGYGSGSRGLGEFPPTPKQIETMAQAIVAIADGLWLTIDKKHVLTHGEAANNEDGYTDAHNPYAWWNDSYGDGDTRGDLEYLGTPESPVYNPKATDGSRGGDVLRGKANWYRNQKKKPQQESTPSAKRSKWFSDDEMRCHGRGCCNGGADKVSSKLLSLLDQLRENIGGPLSVSCMYRCPTHNAEVGGVTNSQHVLGTAADVLQPHWLDFNTFKWYVEQLPFDGIGLYRSSGFIHVDVRHGGVGSKIYWEG